ncbi:hypothetical protein SLG_22230 [Sphingobium sp. SYK-6]|uniref:DUF4376 domain-containing protein n=1 Tax=Sphingobium sp. (strain NBRC 103272 / SYK-6) TaxID=627192 RepID=UPI000227713E|nr:DUF4376 domain-containing protein [Sphingobium sp. SYK-6]BAK66898.1 hypothetical protein SLG_22230 [Sphingobium sp. SYK-6]
MTVHLFVVDPETGMSISRIEVASVELAAQYPTPDGYSLYVFNEALGDPADFHTAKDGDEIIFVLRAADPGVELALAKVERWEAVKRIRDAAFLVTPTVFGRFDSDQAGRDNIAGKLAEFRELEALGMALPEAVTWKLADNTFIDTLTPTQLRQVGVRFSQYRSDVYARSWALETEIGAATSISALMAIDIHEGWPIT